MTREIVSVNLNGTRFPADIVSKNDFDFMRQDGDIGSMDYDQAVKNGEIFFGWSTWMDTHSVCNAAATLGVLNPELADSWVRI